MDPRIAGRRAEVQRRRRRRWWWVLGSVLVLGILVGCAHAVSRSALLDVDRVLVEGAEHTSGAEIRSAAGIDAGEAMIGLDPEGAGRRIEALPWVAEAEVRRDWPGTVEIEVGERVPVAVVETTSGTWSLVDAEGRVLDSRGEPGAWLRLEQIGPVGEPGSTLEGADELLEVAATLPEEVRARVAAVRHEEDEIRLRFPGQARVRFGDASALERKHRAIATVLDRVDDRCLELIDVRVPGAPTVTRRASCAAPPPPTAAPGPGPSEAGVVEAPATTIPTSSGQPPTEGSP